MKLLLILLTTSALSISQRHLFHQFPIYHYLNALQNNGYPLINGPYSDAEMNGYIEPSFTEQNRGIETDHNEALQGRNSHRTRGEIRAEPRPIDGNLSSRTIVLFSTITRTATSRKLCIPNTLFKDAEAAASVCRRKRGLILEMLNTEELLPTSLSDVRIEPTAMPSDKETTRKEATSAELHTLLSSKDIIEGEKVTNIHDHKIAKRFLRNRYVVPRITTTYAFVTTLVRKTIRPAGNTKILCRPNGIEVC